MAYTGTSVNTSPTIALPASEDITNGGGKFVKITSGAVVLCDAGDAAIGALVLQTKDAVAKDESVTVQLDRRALVVAGGTFAAGDYFAAGANGVAVKATSGNAIVAVALADAVAGDIVEVLLTHGSVSA